MYKCIMYRVVLRLLRMKWRPQYVNIVKVKNSQKTHLILIVWKNFKFHWASELKIVWVIVRDIERIILLIMSQSSKNIIYNAIVWDFDTSKFNCSLNHSNLKMKQLFSINIPPASPFSYTILYISHWHTKKSICNFSILFFIDPLLLIDWPLAFNSYNIYSRWLMYWTMSVTCINNCMLVILPCFGLQTDLTVNRHACLALKTFTLSLIHKAVYWDSNFIMITKLISYGNWLVYFKDGYLLYKY